jgi:hypothetical protein
LVDATEGEPTDEMLSLYALGYPLAMVLAERIVTAIQRGTANTRWRDGADIYLLSGRHEIDGTQLHRSLVTVAANRGAALTHFRTCWPATSNWPRADGRPVIESLNGPERASPPDQLPAFDTHSRR